jgi:predicted O-linked N-acetylglucosamine transferase (SPINDLY family)
MSQNSAEIDIVANTPEQLRQRELTAFEERISTIDSWSHTEFSNYLNILILSGEYERARQHAAMAHQRAPTDLHRGFEYARFLTHEDDNAGVEWFSTRFKDESWIASYLAALLQFEAGNWTVGMSTIREAARNAPPMPDVLYGYVLNSMYAPELDPIENMLVMRELARRQFGQPVQPTGSVSKRPRYIVGFVCSNLRRHAISNFFLPLLAHLDRKKFMVIVFSSTRRVDGVTLALQKMSDLWYDTPDMSDEELLTLIRSDRVDILIDLDNHTPSNRLRVFSQRAAPIQMTFYGYNSTTGLESMDYRLTDSIVDPCGNENHYTEKLLRTRSCHAAYHGATAPATPAPSLADGHLVFGSFNDSKKINSIQIQQWARILRGFPDSHLHVVGVDDGFIQLRLRRLMREYGINASQVTIEERLELLDLYHRVQSVDFAIDSWPFGGAVTTAMTLSLGVPLVTATGPRAVSRVSASMLNDLGLQQHIVSSPDQIGTRVLEVGAQPLALSEQRSALTQRFVQTIGNGERLGQEVGELLIRAIERYRKGKAADHDSLP